MTSAYSINLNFNNTIPVKTDFTFKQGDKGITLNLTTIGLDTTGTTAHIVFKRSNGTSVEAELTGQTGPSYSYTILGNEFEIPGVVVADLKLYNGDTQRVSTASFIFLVTGDTMDGVGGGTGGYSDQLEQLSQEFEETLEEYQAAFGDVGAINPRGEYSALEEYTALDLVSYNGNSYLCREGCTGIAPTNITYWQVFASGGGGGGAVDSVNGQTGDVVLGAEDIPYDNTPSGLTATKVQGAIDEVNGAMQYLYNNTGGKNQIPYPYNQTSFTLNGITFTDIGDGTIKVGSTNAQTATSDTYFGIHALADGASISKGHYILNGCPNGGGANTYEIAAVAKRSNNTNIDTAFDYGDGETLDSPDEDFMLYSHILIHGGVTVPAGGIIFKPMLRDASISDDTYVPYAMTNRELTDKVKGIISAATNASDFAAFKAAIANL